MRYNIKKIILTLLLFFMCMSMITTINHSIYKKNANKEIERLKNEISNLENEILEVENKLAAIEDVKEEVEADNEEKVEEVVNNNEIVDNTETITKPFFYLSDYQRHIVEYIVTGESVGEPYDGQVAVAQCLLNACLKDGLQPSEVRKKYQYSGWNTNVTESVKKAVSAVFDDGYNITDEYILYFYAPKYSKGTWHETQKFVMEIGGHKFFAEW